ncbi:MAG TPA: hypothetical protein VI216_03205 [Candidatus Acidoferrales bacterium]
MSCPICGKRPPKRFCPAKGEKICAICCGREREVTIDCPSGCPHLLAAHRYEAEHRQPLSAEEFPYRDIQFPVDFVYERWPVVTSIATAILVFQVQHKDVDDSAVRSALEALAEMYRTLGSGIYYERPPDVPLARALYAQIAHSLQEFQKSEPGRSNLLKDSDTFQLLVFLLRIAKQESNGRPLSRAFLDFLRARFPLPADAVPQDAPRIIVP